MLSRRISVVAVMVGVMFRVDAPDAIAQYYNNGCSSCGTAMPMAAPVAQCTPIQPVYQTCYQTVPVTTYAREKQTVEVPYYETAYEDREVTVMRPVTRQREVEIPTVSYQNVTEVQTVNRDMGRWVTRYQPVARCAPCQVDPRPGVIGWLNRTGYSMQTAFMPNYTTSRQYVPNMMTCSVPVTRQVAIQGTRRVTVNETQMVAERKTERVAVQKLAYRKEEVTVMRPQTAYRTVPIGTSVAYGPGYGTATAYGSYYGAPAMAYGYPILNSTEPTRAALAPTPDPLGSRSADRAPFTEDDPRSSSNSFKRESSSGTGTGATGSSLQRTFPENTAPGTSPASTEPFMPGLGPSVTAPAGVPVAATRIAHWPVRALPTPNCHWRQRLQNAEPV
jgi:hypothetical protein